MGKFGPNNQNCQFILKFGTWVHVLKWWPQTNVMEHFLCIGSARYTRESPPGKCGCFLPIRICRIQWLCLLFRFRPQIPFLGKFGSKNQNCQFILKFGTWTNSNIQNSMAMFNFSAFYWNYPFWANLVKIACLSWNLISRLIRICRI